MQTLECTHILNRYFLPVIFHWHFVLIAVIKRQYLFSMEFCSDSVQTERPFCLTSLTLKFTNLFCTKSQLFCMFSNK